MVFFTFSAVAVIPPKPGSTCSKFGLIQNYKGYMYTCIKSGKKLVWNKGIIIKNANSNPLPSSSPTPNPTSNSSLDSNDLEADGYPKNIPAPNRTCPEDGLKATLYGGNLTCIKGKWVLDEGSKISPAPSMSSTPKPSATPTPTPKPSATPTLTPRPSPTTTSLKKYIGVSAPLNSEIPDLNPSNALLEFDSEIAIKARKEMLSRLKLKSNDKPNIEWIIDPKADLKEIEQYQKEVPYAIQFYGFARDPKTLVRIYLGSSENFQWLYDILSKDLAPEGLEGNWLEAKLQRAKSDSSFHGGAGGLVAKDGAIVVFFNYGSKMSDFETLQTQISFHEYTHVVQKAYLSGNMSPMLCWVREGYANYIGYNLSTRYSTAAYLNAWNQQFQFADIMPELNGWRTKSAKDWVQWFIDSEKKTPYECDSYDNYAIGSIAWEYIHGTYGYQAVDRFYRGLAKSYVGVCPSTMDSNNIICPGWKKLYLETFGNDPESDYLKFGQYIENKIEWMNTSSKILGNAAEAVSPPSWKVQAKY